MAAIVTAAACAESAVRDSTLASRSLSAFSVATDTLPGTYTRVLYPTAFGDTLLIVPDLGENLIWRIDVTAGDREPFGSRGGGPGEYAKAGWSMRGRGDSVVITQGGWMQPFAVLSVVDGRGRSVASPIRDEPMEARLRRGFQSFLFVTAADSSGVVYGFNQRLPLRPDFVPPPDDTLVSVLRLPLDVGTIDTVFTAGASTLSRRGAEGSRSDRRVRLGLGAYAPASSWVVAEDGRSAEVDGARYRVIHRDADGMVRDSFTLAYEAVPVTDAAWTAHVDSQRRQMRGLIQMSLRGIGAESRAPDEKDYIEPDRPLTMPPVRGDDALRLAGDVLWVPVNDREPPAPPTYDLVHLVRRARLARLVLAANERVVLATPTTLYVVAKDEDDLERLIAYRLPAQIR